jgi:hypothetical protein
MRRTLLIAVLLALAAPATALAGGWTTVGLTAPPAEDVAAGSTWNAELTVLQHGRTPLDGQTPIVTISSGKRTVDFTATPTAKPGVYRAAVVFPAAGSWRVAVDHGWGVQHEFGPFAIDGPAGASAPAAAAPTPAPASVGAAVRHEDDNGWIAVLAAVVAGLVAAAATFVVRRRGSGPATAP